MNSKYATKNRFIFSNLNIYLNKELDSIENYPSNISNIIYDYQFEGCKNIDIDDFVKTLKNVL